MYDSFSDGYEEISLDQAQAIVYDAIDYANKLGFEPHKDFQQTKNHLGTWCGEPKLAVLSWRQALFYSGTLWQR